MSAKTKKIRYQDKPWISNYEKGVNSKLKYENVTLPEYLERSTERYPDKMCLTFEGYKLTYKEVNEMVNRFAAYLLDNGIKKGDRISILLPNMIQCVVAYYAVLRIGAVAVLNNPLYSDRELLHHFKDSQSKMLITVDLLGNRMIDLRPATKIKQIIIASIGDYLPFPKNKLFPLVGKKQRLSADVKSAPDVYRWKDIIAKYSPITNKIKIDI